MDKMKAASAFEKYREQEVTMANPAALIVMLYNACIKRLKLAQKAIEKKNYEESNANLKKAQDILSELLCSLDLKYPVAGNLMALYEFMLREIRRINASKESEGITPLVDMLSRLRDAWVQVEKTCRQPYEYGDIET